MFVGEPDGKRRLDSVVYPGWCSASTPGFGPGSGGWNPPPGAQSVYSGVIGDLTARIGPHPLRLAGWIWVNAIHIRRVDADRGDPSSTARSEVRSPTCPPPPGRNARRDII